MGGKKKKKKPLTLYITLYDPPLSQNRSSSQNTGDKALDPQMSSPHRYHITEAEITF